MENSIVSTFWPKRLRRSESFLGIHFDFHAGDDCTEIGKRVTRGMVARIIDLVRPDYIQCDCKGHRGLSSYPTKVGYPAPGFARDALRIWREVTAERGVALYMHYSGVWDTEALKRHPSWARVDENGKRDKNNTSVFGPYVDKLMIPQLKELCDEYGVDGVWVDGECWSTAPDYGRAAIEAFRGETGIRNIPRKPDDPHYQEFREFCREGFRRYLRHYVDEMHRHNRDFQVCSNWAFTNQMPEPVTADVDFLSGDFSEAYSRTTAQLKARCIAPQGKPWDLMAWSFMRGGEGKCDTTKTVMQLKHEAAIVLATGGGFEVYFKQRRDHSIHESEMEIMAEVARFCRERQDVCHRAEAVPQVALLYSTAAYYRKSARLFMPTGELGALDGMLSALLESQNSVEVLGEHHLKGRMGKYPLIVVPEWDFLETGFKGELVSYVRAGGKLLLVGPAAAAMFEKELDVALRGGAEERKRWIEYGGGLGEMQTTYRSAKLGRRARPFGRVYVENDLLSANEPAGSIARLGKGRIAALFMNFGTHYHAARTVVARDFLNGLVRTLFPAPLVEVTGSHQVDVAVNRKDGALTINLVNTAGPRYDAWFKTYDEIPAIGPLTVTIRRRRGPSAITLHPAGRPLKFGFANGKVKLTLPTLKIHDIIVARD